MSDQSGKPKDSSWKSRASWIIGLLLLALFAIAVMIAEPASIPYRLSSALVGAIFGGLGGGLGALIYYVFTKKFGAAALTAGAFFGFIASQIVEQGFNFAGGKVYEGVVRPLVDRTAFEKRLSTDPTTKWLAILKRVDSQNYEKILNAIISRVQKGEALEQTIGAIRKEYVEPLFGNRAGSLSDEVIVQYTKLVSAQMKIFGEKNPALCVKALRNENLGDIRPYLNAELIKEELHLMEVVLLTDIADKKPVYSQVEQDRAMAGIFARLSELYGDAVSYLDPSSQSAGKEREVCVIAAAFFDEIAAMPQASAAALMRAILQSSTR